MTDNAELKRLAEAAYPGPWYVENGMDQVRDNADDFVCETGEDEPINSAFIAAANPAAVLALIAENERLKNRLEVDPRHDYDGISTRDATVKVLDEQVDQLKAENERLAKTADCWDRLNVLNKALSDSFQAERDQAEQDYKDVVGTIELRDSEISKLRAEVAGLRTGYEAYEQVNAELKAEVEGLRKDSESYRLLSFCHGQGTLELVRSHHELCAEIRRLKILAGEPVPQTPEEFVGPSPEGPTARIRRKLAALGKGEQS